MWIAILICLGILSDVLTVSVSDIMIFFSYYYSTIKFIEVIQLLKVKFVDILLKLIKLVLKCILNRKVPILKIVIRNDKKLFIL